jgi:hypothetical protein
LQVLRLVSFSITVVTQALAAFPGAEGYGTETDHGRGGIVVKVTNLNDSGAGSLRAALNTEQARIVIFTVSGTIELDDPIIMGQEHSDCGVFGETAPGDGICVRASATMEGNGNSELIRISPLQVPDDTNLDGPCHDVLFRHMRFRHGARNRGTLRNNDVFNIYHGSYNIVLDHCSFTWSSDETIGIAAFSYVSSDDPFFVRDVTISHCIIGEADQTHNTGVILSSGAEHSGDNIYNISYIRNYSCHLAFRDIMVDTGSGDSTKGVQAINNVHYDVESSHHSLGQNQYTNQKTYFDCINDVFISSGRTGSFGRPKFNVNRLYTAIGDDFYTPLAFDHGKVRRPPPDVPQSAGVWHPISIHATGCISREVGLGDTTPSSASYEADNELFVNKQYKNSTSGGGPFDGGETYEWRSSTSITQPTNAVTTVSATQAYTNLIINRDVGAKPEDSVCTRQINAVQNGQTYSAYNVPGYPGSSATWPTLNTDTVHQNNASWTVTDTSGNGVPDYYQTTTLGKTAGDAYNPANTYTLGNGYSDIENWIWTLQGLSA